MSFFDQVSLAVLCLAFKDLNISLMQQKKLLHDLHFIDFLLHAFTPLVMGIIDSRAQQARLTFSSVIK